MISSSGNTSSFTDLTFLACFSTVLPDQNFQVILETYPGPNHPKLYRYDDTRSRFSQALYQVRLPL